MSRFEMRRIVEQATVEDQQFLFICLAEKLFASNDEELKAMDCRLYDLESGKNRLSLGEFEAQLDAPHPV